MTCWKTLFPLVLSSVLIVACSDDDNNNNDKKTEPSAGCTYTGSKCNADKTALLTCKNGVETSQTCACENDACKSSESSKCTYSGSKCNADKTALLTCTNGVETSQTCACENDACKSSETSKCTYTGSKCNADKTALLTCTNGVETSQTCACENDACKEAPVPDGDKVGWCRIVNDGKEMTSDASADSDNIYAQVFVKDCTHYQNHCDKITAQIGYGAADADDASAFTWSSAAINEGYNGTGGELHDEYVGHVNSATAGDYSIVYRFSVDNGTSWTYCDTADDNDFHVNNGIKWHVNAPEVKTVGWCQTFTNELYNNTLTTEVNVPSDSLYGQAYVQNCTEEQNQCASLQAYIAYGKATDELNNFTYETAGFHSDENNNDEFMGYVTPSEPGDYKVFYAFSVDNGEKVPCANDNSGNFVLENAANLHVSPAAAVSEHKFEFGEADTFYSYKCGIEKDHADSLSGKAGETVSIKGQIYHKSGIDGDSSSTNGVKWDKVVDARAYWIEEYRYAENRLAVGSEPYWHKIHADYNQDYSGNNNEYVASVVFPREGAYKIAFTFDLKADPSSETERAQRIYCFYDWQNEGVASINISN